MGLTCLEGQTVMIEQHLDHTLGIRSKSDRRYIRLVVSSTFGT